MADIDTMSDMLTRAGVQFSRFSNTLELENDVVVTFDGDGKLVRIGSDLNDAAKAALEAID